MDNSLDAALKRQRSFAGRPAYIGYDKNGTIQTSLFPADDPRSPFSAEARAEPPPSFAETDITNVSEIKGDPLESFAISERPAGERAVDASSTEVQAMMPSFGADGRPDPSYMESRANLPLEQQKKIFEAEAFQAAGFSLGFPIAVLATLPDLISLPPLIAAGMITADEGKKLEGVLNMLQYVPSAMIGKVLTDQGQSLGLNKDQIDAFGQGYLGGELSSIIVNAVPGAAKLVQGAKWLKGKAGEYAAGAPERIAERGEGVTLTSGIDLAAAFDEAIVAGQSLIPAIKGVKPSDELIVLHNMNPESLEDLDTLGGLPVPSLAIVKSSTPLEKFGSITLIGTPDMAKPSARNPVYRSDAYVKRRPSITYEEDMKPTFYNQKTRKEQVANLKNMVSAMKGGAGEEMMGVTAGNLRAIGAKPFNTLAEVKRSRDRLISEKDMARVKDEIDRQFIGLVDSISDDISDIERSYRNSGMDYNDITKDLVRGVMRDEAILSRLTKDTKQRIEIFKESATKLPTEYFEINPQRSVGLSEFKAALVPESLSADDVRRLERAGVRQVIKYADEADRKEKIKSMRDVMFTIGGSSIVANQIIDQAQDETQQGEIK